MTNEKSTLASREGGKAIAQERSLFARILHLTPRVFGAIGLITLVWSVSQSWIGGAIAAGLFSLMSAAFEYAIGNHFQDAWFQKSMIRLMWISFGFLAFSALLAFGFLALAWILGI